MLSAWAPTVEPDGKVSDGIWAAELAGRMRLTAFATNIRHGTPRWNQGTSAHWPRTASMPLASPTSTGIHGQNWIWLQIAQIVLGSLTP
ncbi:hypothetical protein [Streptomyces sp. NPDC005096]|uniref:hypothetical protein n=1 Tax=Streptomyces sp. NPDC005096 TaxID=3154559 RepID=UPI0033B5EF24